MKVIDDVLWRKVKMDEIKVAKGSKLIKRINKVKEHSL